MGKKTMNLVYESGISELTERNSSFDIGVLRVAYTGKNRNNSFISKETFESCIKSIYNCPIVANYNRDENDFGGHDIEVVDDDNKMRIVNLTVPLGVIPESAQYHWEELEDASGIHEYLLVDALIWKRQEAYQKLVDDGFASESMEISIKDGHMEDGVYIIDDFEFTAFCLLGSKVDPCFEGATLEMFSLNGFKDEYAQMMAELKESFNTTQPPADTEDCINSKNSEEGGREALNEMEMLLTEFGLTANDVDFDIEAVTVDEARAKLEVMQNNSQEPADENFALESQVRDALECAIKCAERRVEIWDGEEIDCAKYCFHDYDKDLSEVYVWDVDTWQLFGFSYTFDGDRAVIDMGSKKRMKVALVDYDEGSQAEPKPMPFANVYSEAKGRYDNAVASKKDLEEKYQIASDKIEEMQTELDELRKFKKNYDESVAESERQAVFAKFEDLNGIQAFEDLKENCADISLEDLEEKCYAIRGRNGTSAKFSLNPTMPKIIVQHNNDANDPYGGIFAKYGKEPIKKN